MAVVTVKSAPITNLDASPRVANQAGLGAPYRVVENDAFAAVANGDSIGSKYVLIRVPSNARVKDLRLSTTAITTCAGDIGLYYASSANDVGAGQTAGAVIDADFFASAQSLAAALSDSNVIDESGVYLTTLRDNPLWEAAGLTSDPGGKFDIVITLTAAAASAGTVYAKVGYVEG